MPRGSSAWRRCRSKWFISFLKRRGARFEWEAIELSYLPLPHLQIQRARITLPGGARGTLGSVTVYPKVLSLLVGKAGFSRIEIDAPDLKVGLPEAEGRGSAGFPFQLLMAPLVLDEPNLEVAVRNGALEVAREGGPPVSFKEMALEFVLPPKGFTFRVSCTSSLWEKISLTGRFDVAAFKGEGRLNLLGFLPQRLTDLLAPGASLGFGKSPVHAGVEFKMDGLANIRADVQGSFPALTLIRGQGKTTLKSGRFQASASLDPGGIKVSLKDFRIHEPRLVISGEFLQAGGGDPIRVWMEGMDVDILSVRDVALSLAGEDPLVARVFHVLRGGEGSDRELPGPREESWGSCSTWIVW